MDPYLRPNMRPNMELTRIEGQLVDNVLGPNVGLRSRLARPVGPPPKMSCCQHAMKWKGQNLQLWGSCE